jgi:hypothetical protein
MVRKIVTVTIACLLGLAVATGPAWASSTKYFHMSTSGVRFGSTAAPASVTFWSPTGTRKGGLSVRGTLVDTAKDGHSVFFHAWVTKGMDGSIRWSPRIYTTATNTRVKIDQYLLNGDVTSTDSVTVEVCTDRGTFHRDSCVTLPINRY